MGTPFPDSETAVHQALPEPQRPSRVQPAAAPGEVSYHMFTFLSPPHCLQYQFLHDSNPTFISPQAVDDVVSDRFPVSLSEAIYLAGLQAQIVLGSYADGTSLVDYM